MGPRESLDRLLLVAKSNKLIGIRMIHQIVKLSNVQVLIRTNGPGANSLLSFQAMRTNLLSLLSRVHCSSFRLCGRVSPLDPGAP